VFYGRSLALGVKKICAGAVVNEAHGQREWPIISVIMRFA
jgi:hypothetical protein